MHSRFAPCLLALVACGDDVAGTAGFGTGESGPGADTSSTSATSTSAGTADTTSVAADTSSEEGAKFDVGPHDDVTADDLCPDEAPAAPDFSYIWIANTPEGTVSKIDTVTMTELGRYLVRADGAGSPSRTSVNLRGDMVVANRFGGVTKIYARTEDCAPGMPTSTGPDDVVPWMDGCIAWHTPFDYVTQRPVAWTPGELSPITCQYEDAKVWSSGAEFLDGVNELMEVVLIDGDTGVVEEVVPLTGLPVNFFGIYGGASDAEGNFWGIQNDGIVLVRVDRETFAVEAWHDPPGRGYGFTVDGQGRPWTCDGDIARYDPATETWATRYNLGIMGAGCMADAEGRLWVGEVLEGKEWSYRLLALDVETMDVVRDFAMPSFPKGVSIDFYGNVWAVSDTTDAYRVDPDSGAYSKFTGLDGAYTYSDMTGWALGNVVGTPPAG